MAQQKLPLKDILAAVDMGAKTVWDELDDEERKQVSFWLLNRCFPCFPNDTTFDIFLHFLMIQLHDDF